MTAIEKLQRLKQMVIESPISEILRFMVDEQMGCDEDATNLLVQLGNLERDNAKGILSTNDFTIFRNKISEGVLTLAKNIEQDIVEKLRKELQNNEQLLERELSLLRQKLSKNEETERVNGKSSSDTRYSKAVKWLDLYKPAIAHKTAVALFGQPSPVSTHFESEFDRILEIVRVALSVEDREVVNGLILSALFPSETYRKAFALVQKEIEPKRQDAGFREFSEIIMELIIKLP